MQDPRRKIVVQVEFVRIRFFCVVTSRGICFTVFGQSGEETVSGKLKPSEMKRSRSVDVPRYSVFSPSRSEKKSRVV